MAFFDKIFSLHKHKVRCASVHLISGVHWQCLLNFWLRKYSQFIYCLLFFTMKGSVQNSKHISRATFTSLFKITKKPHPVTFQHPTTPIYGCTLSFATNNLECAVAKLYSVCVVAKFWLSKCWRFGSGKFCGHGDGGWGCVTTAVCTATCYYVLMVSIITAQLLWEPSIHSNI